MTTAPPPLPARLVQQGDVPPVIRSLCGNAATRVVPPPLPEEVLQKEMSDGCLSGAVGALEKERRKAQGYGYSSLVWCLLALLSVAALVSTLDSVGRLEDTVAARKQAALVPLCVCGTVCIVSLAIGCHFYGRSNTAKWRYRQGYKEKIFTAAIRLLNPAFRYEPAGGISYERFLESRMFIHRIDRYGSEDRIRGMLGATAFEFAEVRAHYKVNPLLRGKHDPAYQPVFQGLYFIADFNKHFSTSVLVLPRTAEERSSVRDRARIVHLEDPEFEREFIVVAEDEIEVRYLLTPALMRRMLEIRRIRRQPVSFSFLNEKLHVALMGYEDLFEPDPGSPSASFRQVQSFLNQARDVLSLVDMLNLNTRIWSKR